MSKYFPIIRKLKKYFILLLSVVVHLFVLFAVSDLYFTHHPNNDVELTESSSTEPIAKRIVVFLADGLNSDSIFNSHLYKNLFITNFTEHPGTFGIAKARFPTTERAGHLALLTGTYEDPVRSILNSLIGAEVTIDNLINRTSHTWFWGNPSIIDIFDYDNKDKLHKAQYNKSVTPTNSWIASNIKEFLTHNAQRIQFNDDNTIFFIHMPLSASTKTIIEKNTEIKILDMQIKQIVSSFKEAFMDNSITFFVTSAYGLTDWGSHGGHSRAETETPVIAWGAGIKENSKPVNMKQIDFPSLISSLTSVSIPKNSLGIVPVNYLDLSKRQYLHDQTFNAIQLFKIAEAKKNFFEKMHYVKFTKKPEAFKGLDTEGLLDRLAEIHFAMLHSKPKKVSNEIHSFVTDIFESIAYYETFYNVKLIYSITSGYSFWIIYMFGYSFFEVTECFFSLRLPIGILLISLFFSMIKPWSSLLYTFYLAFPFAMLWLAAPYVYTILKEVPQILIYNKLLSSLCFMHIQLLLLATLSREIVSLQILFVGLSVVVPNIYNRSLSKKAEIMWPSCCVSLALSSFLGRLQLTICSVSLLIYGFCIWLYMLRKCRKQIYSDLVAQEINPKLDLNVLGLQLLCFSLAGFYKAYHIFFLSRCHIFPWLIVLIPLILTIFPTKLPGIRMVSVLFGLVPFYFITATSDEMIFLLIFVATVYSWGTIETASDAHIGEMSIACFMKELNTINDKSLFIRRLYATSVFVYAAFYGAGNVFNINSYSVWWFTSLASSSSYILPICIVLMKIATPMIIHFAILYACNKSSKVSTFHMVCLLTVVFDVVILEMMLLFNFRTIIPWVKIDIAQIIAITLLNLLIIYSYFLVNVINSAYYKIIVQKSK
ncbi:GPI ethanolamine phosphate transferase 1-like [Anthonomus grandis grandis]|uniref:GPI ethanolamine phosphate transferase 1-like n=1 Tax=Anthonomus grandis grandis TaxID=2921223 RepID=UPI002166A808|nr:GPI ethanolamine phosphate transferase 1-like [Anthonomus grandis grandis]